MGVPEMAPFADRGAPSSNYRGRKRRKSPCVSNFPSEDRRPSSYEVSQAFEADKVVPEEPESVDSARLDRLERVQDQVVTAATGTFDEVDERLAALERISVRRQEPSWIGLCLASVVILALAFVLALAFLVAVQQ